MEKSGENQLSVTQQATEAANPLGQATENAKFRFLVSSSSQERRSRDRVGPNVLCEHWNPSRFGGHSHDFDHLLTAAEVTQGRACGCHPTEVPQTGTQHAATMLVTFNRRFHNRSFGRRRYGQCVHSPVVPEMGWSCCDRIYGRG